MRTDSGMEDFKYVAMHKDDAEGDIAVIYDARRGPVVLVGPPGVVPDLMRIGGFVQLKRLTRIHPGRRSFAKHRI